QTSSRVLCAFNQGEWHRAEALIEQFRLLTRDVTRGDWHVASVQAQIALARGDDSALALAEECLARNRRTSQPFGRFLAALARVHVDQGRPADARPLVDDLVAIGREKPRSLGFGGVLDLGWLIHDLGRPERPPVIPYPVWNDPAQAIARGDLVAAAELLAATVVAGAAASARLRAAEQLAADGRREEAPVHAEPAAAFYRSVDATAYLARAESLLAVVAQEV